MNTIVQMDLELFRFSGERCFFEERRAGPPRSGHRLDEPTGLSLGMVVSLQRPLPFPLAESLFLPTARLRRKLIHIERCGVLLCSTVSKKSIQTTQGERQATVYRQIRETDPGRG